MTPIRLMIIDDEQDLRRLTKFSLMQACPDIEFTFSEFSNGAQAIDHIKQSMALPDVILLDINMPVMDGEDFIRDYVALPMPKTFTDLYILSNSNSRFSNDLKYAVTSFFEKPLSDNDINKIIESL